VDALAIELTPIYGGYRVKETETHYIDVLSMLVNYRIVRTPKASPQEYDRGWCYQGRGEATFVAAVLAAARWDGADDTEPEGYSKRALLEAPDDLSLFHFHLISY
jgi:hypothetical protein